MQLIKKHYIKNTYEHVYQGLKNNNDELTSNIVKNNFRNENKILTMSNNFEMQLLKKNIIKSPHEHVFQGHLKTNMMNEQPIL